MGVQQGGGSSRGTAEEGAGARSMSERVSPHSPGPPPAASCQGSWPACRRWTPCSSGCTCTPVRSRGAARHGRGALTLVHDCTCPASTAPQPLPRLRATRCGARLQPSVRRVGWGATALRDPLLCLRSPVGAAHLVEAALKVRGRALRLGNAAGRRRGRHRGRLLLLLARAQSTPRSRHPRTRCGPGRALQRDAQCPSFLPLPTSCLTRS